MPLVTVTVQKPKSRAFKDAILAGVHRALIGAGVPETDRFQRVLEQDAEGFRFDPRYPGSGGAARRQLHADRNPVVGRAQREGQAQSRG